MAEFPLVELFTKMAGRKASDLHLQVRNRPIYRINGDLVTLEDYPVIDEESLRAAVFSLITEKKRAQFEEGGNVDTALEIPNVGRFRLNIYQKRGTMALAGRRIATSIPDFQTLNLPDSVGRIAEFPIGLVLVTGPTGSGKSSTLAAIINHINKTRNCHILCIEDPIEFLYSNDKAIITQREVGIDVSSFKEALKYAVRQDPDVILVGEIRDVDTLEFAITGAETGHLVLGTLHSANATQTIGRMLNFYTQDKQPSIRRSIGLHLRSVVSQLLLPSVKEGVSLVPACEVMFVNSTITRLVAEGKDEKIVKAIKAGKEDGMVDFEMSLYNLFNAGFISRETAMENAENPDSLDMKLKGIFLTEEGGIIG